MSDESPFRAIRGERELNETATCKESSQVRTVGDRKRTIRYNRIVRPDGNWEAAIRKSRTA